MTCEACIADISGSLQKLSGIQKVEANLKDQLVSIEGTGSSDLLVRKLDAYSMRHNTNLYVQLRLLLLYLQFKRLDEMQFYVVPEAQIVSDYAGCSWHMISYQIVNRD
jgi:copper chaperone CopZ